MSLFEALGSRNQNDVLNQLKANPEAMLKGAGYSIPQGMNDPRQIVQHLIQSGQVSNPRLQMIQRMMGGK